MRLKIISAVLIFVVIFFTDVIFTWPDEHHVKIQDEEVEYYGVDPVLIEEKLEEIATLKLFEQQVDLLAHLIWNETGILGEKSMYYTGSVVLNRMTASYFPNTLEEVIYQPGQYAVTWTGLIERDCPDKAYVIARDLLENGSVLPEDVIFQAQFKQGSSVYEQIGNTYYCRK